MRRRNLCRLLPLLLALAGLRPAPVQAAVTSTSIVPPNAPQSVFVDEPGVGRDPFYPMSRRRTLKIVPTTPTDLSQGTVPDFITLKGISVIKDKRLAIINNYTVAQGEEFSLRYGTHVIRVKCLEVKESSAVIGVNGATKELTLRPGFN